MQIDNNLLSLLFSTCHPRPLSTMAKSKSSSSTSSRNDNVNTGGTGKSPPGDQRNVDTVVPENPGTPSAGTLDVLIKFDKLSLDDILALKKKCDLRIASETKPSAYVNNSNITKQGKRIPPWERTSVGERKDTVPINFGKQFDESGNDERNIGQDFKEQLDQELENLRGFRPTWENSCHKKLWRGITILPISMTVMPFTLSGETMPHLSLQPSKETPLPFALKARKWISPRER